MEVFVNGFLLFSKLKSGNWPKKALITKRFNYFVEGKNINFYDDDSVEPKPIVIVDEKKIAERARKRLAAKKKKAGKYKTVVLAG